MILKAKIVKGEIQFKDKKWVAEQLNRLEGKNITFEIVKEKHTDQQRKALHLYFELLAVALNDGGFDMQKVLKVDVPWTKDLIKELIWRPVQKAILKKDSTTKLNKTGDIDRIFDIINRIFSNPPYCIHIPFPSIDSAMDRDNNY